MPVELATVRVVSKPWGVCNLQPWSGVNGLTDPVGELWFERADQPVQSSALLLKLLFTSEPLSIQVHPDDSFAQAMGMPNGKTEAWYILSAESGAQVGIGLTRQITSQHLGSSIDDGSIADLINWQPVAKDDVIYIPAGTIHAIGAGIVLAEIQQRSDTTFRLFDFGRHRELDKDNGVAAADLKPLGAPQKPIRLTTARTVLICGPHFILERIDLAQNSSWALLAEAETWIFVIGGHAAVGLTAVSIGQTIFVSGGRTSIEVGAGGLTGLIAYPANAPVASLLQRLGEGAGNAGHSPGSVFPHFTRPTGLLDLTGTNDCSEAHA